MLAMPVTPSHLTQVAEIARHYGATRLLLFGSALTNPDEAHDIDLLCEGLEGWNLLQCNLDMEHALRMNVDVVPITRPLTRFVEYNLPFAQTLL
jgi:uncharacterized protein